MTADRRQRILTSTLGAEVTGIEHSLIRVAHRLRDRGVDMVLAAPAGGGLEERWTNMGLEFVAVPGAERSGFRDADGNASSPRTLARQVRLSTEWIRAVLPHARGADVIHSNSVLSHIDSVAVGRLAGTPVILELHDVLAPGVGRTVLSAAVRGATETITVSEAAKAQLSPSAQRSARVLTQAVDTDVFTPGPASPQMRSLLTASPGSPLVAAVGRIDPAKGLEHLLEAVAYARSIGVDMHVAIVGASGTDSGRHLDMLRRRAAEILPGAHRFIGLQDDVVAVLRSIDVLSAPSVCEPFGLVVAESLACGTPVVVSRSGGFLDYIRDGHNGVMCDPADHVGYAEALIDACENADLRTRVSAEGVETVRAGHSADWRADALVDLYREVAR